MDTNRYRRHARGYAIYGIALLAASITFAYQLFFSSARIEKVVTDIVEKNTSASLTWKVHRVSLFFGIDAGDVQLTSRKSGNLLLKADKIKLNFFLPSVLVGHIGIRELTFDKPVIYLTKEDDTWNWSALSSGKKDEPPPPVKEKKPLPDKIELFLPIKLYANIKVQDLAFHLKTQKESGEPFEANVEHFDFYLATITKTFHAIPLDMDILNLFDTLMVGMNPLNPLKVHVNSGSNVNGPLTLSLALFHDNTSGTLAFSSKLDINSDKLIVSRNGGVALPLEMLVRYHLTYNAPEDKLIMHDFEIRRGQERWIKLKAQVDHVIQPERSLELSITESTIFLDPLASVAALFFGTDPRFGGTAHLAPLTVKGEFEKLNINANLSGENLFFKTASGQKHTLQQFALNADATMNVYPLLPFLKKEDSRFFKKEEAVDKKQLAFGTFYHLNLNNLTAVYNGARLDATGYILPQKGMNAKVKLARLPIEIFTAPYASGLGFVNINLSSPETFETILFDGNVQLVDVRYAVDRSLSGLHRLYLFSSGSLNFTNGFGLQLNRTTLTGRDNAGAEILSVALTNQLHIDKHATRIDTDIDSLNINYPVLHPLLPGSIQSMIYPYYKYLSQGISASGRYRATLASPEKNMDVFFLLKVPYLKLDDLTIDAALSLSDALIQLKRFQLKGLRGSLKADAGGSLVKNAEQKWSPSLVFSLSAESGKMIRVHQNINFSGSLLMNGGIKNDKVDALFSIKNLNVQYYGDRCDQGEDSPLCDRFRVEQVNLHLPIHHDLNIQKPEHITQGAEIFQPDTYGFHKKPNFTIRFVASSHTPRGEYRKDAYVYTGSLIAEGRDDGVAAYISYVNNVLRIDWLRISIYRPLSRDKKEQWVKDSSIDAKNIFFNVADGNLANMEYGAIIKVSNFDLEPYLPKSRSNYDGVISADANISGSNLKDPINGVNARLSVYRLSPQFSGFATRIVMTTSIAAGLVRNTIEIPSMLLELKGGLVYTYIRIRRGSIFPGGIIRPSGDEIRQERIPLARFLERAGGEVKNLEQAGSMDDYVQTPAVGLDE